jgi:hypothetical protein
VGCFNCGVDLLGAAALDDGDHLTRGGILDWKAVGFGTRGPAEGREFGYCLVGRGGHCYSFVAFLVGYWLELCGVAANPWTG